MRASPRVTRMISRIESRWNGILADLDTRKENKTRESDQTQRPQTIASAALPLRNGQDEPCNRREKCWRRACAIHTCIRDFCNNPSDKLAHDQWPGTRIQGRGRNAP